MPSPSPRQLTRDALLMWDLRCRANQEGVAATIVLASRNKHCCVPLRSLGLAPNEWFRLSVQTQTHSQLASATLTGACNHWRPFFSQSPGKHLAGLLARCERSNDLLRVDTRARAKSSAALAFGPVASDALPGGAFIWLPADKASPGAQPSSRCSCLSFEMRRTGGGRGKVARRY